MLFGLEEFLDYKIVLGQVASMEEAIDKINTYGGGHSAVIVTEHAANASTFMNSVDAAAVYHNASYPIYGWWSIWSGR